MSPASPPAKYIIYGIEEVSGQAITGAKSVGWKKMTEIGLVPPKIIEDLILQQFEAPLPKTQDDDDPFIKGEFDVIKELLEQVRNRFNYNMLHINLKKLK